MCNPVVLKEFWLKTGSKLTHGFRDEGGGGTERILHPEGKDTSSCIM